MQVRWETPEKRASPKTIRYNITTNLYRSGCKKWVCCKSARAGHHCFTVVLPFDQARVRSVWTIILIVSKFRWTAQELAFVLVVGPYCTNPSWFFSG